ncbi:MAG: nucleoside 2-deoxyribosyltransferase domain-containing protein [Deltaproteobacteria bacterium]|nr:nucleoside 2-deoxyribosyltransferase domain-containing protein [Deltaproteobacteria bacterium]
MHVFKPPAPFSAPPGARVVFLAGSIEMGAAEDWQTRLAAALVARVGEIVVLNPRRDEWDASWRQSIEEPKFREQVEWELDGLERADVIAMWFAAGTKSPITLLELGLHARGGKLIVGCPDGFWRRGNIEVVCARYGAPLYAAWEPFEAAVVAAC